MCLFIFGCFAKVIANEKMSGEGKFNNHYLSVKVSYWDQRAHVTLINYGVPRTGFISLCLSLVIRRVAKQHREVNQHCECIGPILETFSFPLIKLS